MTAVLNAWPVKHSRLNWDSMQRVAVFRALNLGDMLCVIPALRALRRRLPRSHIALIGLESALPVLPQFTQYIDELIVFPGDRAFPEKVPNDEALPEFYKAMRDRAFDLVLQCHGSGSRSNEIVQAMSPCQWAGFVPDDDHAEPGRLMPWPDHLHEIHRYLALLQYVGIDAHDDDLTFDVDAHDMSQARSLAARVGVDLAKTVIVHAGARLASRRWPPERFAVVASALADEGWQIALTGSPDEIHIVDRILGLVGDERHCVNLCGQTELGVLAGLLSQSRLLICNDTGISHVAAGVRLPSVVIASGSDVNRWAPIDTQKHRVLSAWIACRPCAYDVCPIGHPCALSVTPEAVLVEARRHLHAGGK